MRAGTLACKDITRLPSYLTTKEGFGIVTGR